MRAVLVAGAVLAMVGCKEGEETTLGGPVAIVREAERRAAPIKAADDPRTPFDFARGWGAVHAETDPDVKYKQAAELKRSWEGRRYTWTAYVLASLCIEAKQHCSVNPWERKNTPSREALGGMFPRVAFGDDAWTSVKKSCAGKTGCVVRFSGVLEQAKTSPDEPLALAFGQVKVLEARQPKLGEEWFRKRPLVDARFKTGPERSLRTGKAQPLPDSLRNLKPKTF